VNAGFAAPERELKLDVYGKLKDKDAVKAKVIEVARAKQADIPIIVVL
jgi:hypothetical protein